MAKRRCLICDKLFVIDNEDDKTIKVCSDTCLAALVSKPVQYKSRLQLKQCPICSVSFWADRKNKRFDSSACRYTASYKRRRETLSAVRLDTPFFIEPAYNEVFDAKPGICVICGKPIPGANRPGVKPQVCSVECGRERRRRYANRYRAQKDKEQLAKSGQASKSTSKVSSPDDIASAAREMIEWQRRREARKKWVKIPLEDAARICKEYNLEYGQYQYLRAEGKLEAYIAKQKRSKGE